MNIYSHIIDQSEIIGISPLMVEKSNQLYYNQGKYFFSVYTKHSSIRIESELIQPDVDTDYKTKTEAFKAAYEEARREIIQKIELAI